MIGALVAFAGAFDQVIDAITADWHHPHDQRPFSRLEVITAMIDLAAPPVIHGVTWDAKFGFIHPQRHEQPRLLGHWTM